VFSTATSVTSQLGGPIGSLATGTVQAAHAALEQLVPPLAAPRQAGASASVVPPLAVPRQAGSPASVVPALAVPRQAGSPASALGSKLGLH
jgi:hypothetical protein